MRLSAVVPFWRGQATICDLLATIPHDVSIWVVCDGGEAPNVDFSPYPNVRWEVLPKRRYFAGAVNRGLELALADGADVVLVLNQDVTLHRDPRQVFDQRYGIIGDGVFGHRAWPSGYVQGTFMMIQREVIERIGKFNEVDFPLWGATCEYQLRACRAGYRALPLQDEALGLEHAKVGHYGTAITQALTDEPGKRGLFLHTPPLVSVIVPCYNYGRYLHDNISSLLAQDWQAFEIVIVDDASNDGSTEIARSYADPWRGIRVFVHTRRRGTAATFNTGIRNAFGRYITVVSADDWCEPTRIGELYHFALEHPNAVICDDMWFCSHGERKRVEMKLVGNEPCTRNTMHAGVFYHKHVWEAVGGYPEVMDDGREDWAFSIATWVAGYEHVRYPRPLYCYRREGQGRTERLGISRQYYAEKIMQLWGGQMPCNCGKRNPIMRSGPVARSAAVRTPQTGQREWVEVEYIGSSLGAQTFWGNQTGMQYRFGLLERYRVRRVRREDVPGLLATGQFKVVSGEVAEQQISPDAVSQTGAQASVSQGEGVSVSEATEERLPLVEHTARRTRSARRRRSNDSDNAIAVGDSGTGGVQDGATAVL